MSVLGPCQGCRYTRRDSRMGIRKPTRASATSIPPSNRVSTPPKQHDTCNARRPYPSLSIQSLYQHERCECAELDFDDPHSERFLSTLSWRGAASRPSRRSSHAWWCSWFGLCTQYQDQQEYYVRSDPVLGLRLLRRSWGRWTSAQMLSGMGMWAGWRPRWCRYIGRGILSLILGELG